MEKNRITKFLRTVSAVMALSLVIVAFAYSAPRTAKAATDATTKSYQEQIAEATQKQKELKAKLNSLKSEMSDAVSYKSSLDELANVTYNKIAAAEALTAELEIKISDAEKGIAEKEEAIETTFNNFLERMRVSYEEGEASYLSIILGSENMSDLLAKMDMVSSMLEYDRNLKNQYQSEKEELEATKKTLEEDKALQTELLETLKEDKAHYDSLAKQQATYISSLQADVNATNSAYEKAKAEENRLDKQLQAYLKSLQEKEQTVYVGGEFIWPLPGHTYISSGFGWRTLGGVRDNHRGIDIPAPYATPIRASNGGTIVTATGSGSYGNYVVINHGGGKSTLYAHMSSIAVGVNQKVTQGQIIGYVGSTGYSTGNHLHIEVRIDGVCQNPLNYLSR
ncbi:MAG: hypothetical protein E7660_07825 [Ruminococcaceae bacterium]|nr:hypothetical protein [Oscillospiraceae bacterium]